MEQLRSFITVFPYVEFLQPGNSSFVIILAQSLLFQSLGAVSAQKYEGHTLKQVL